MDTENTSDTENVPLSPLKTAEKDDKESSESCCWSPRFEFDAPRYTNFSSKKYRETRKLLNKLVLNREDDAELESKTTGDIDATDTNYCDDIVNITEIEDHEVILDDISDDSSEIDEWFNRFHPLQEPLRPMTPPGPLISPEKISFNSFKSAVSLNLKASPLKLGNQSPRIELNTPSKGPNTRIGLRSKPARVLKGSNTSSSSTSTNTNTNTENRYYSNGGGSLNSSPSSLIRTNFTNSPPIQRSPIKLTSSPIRNHQSPIITNLNSPIKQNTHNLMTPTRLSINSTVSSVTLSVSSLTKTFYNSDNNQITEPTSPLKMKTKFSEGTASPLRTAVGILQIEEIDTVSVGSKKRSTETGKKSFTNEPPKKTKSMNAELEDIKKLLSQHNNRIRPNNNKKR